MAILTELKDPRVRNVTVTQVEVTSDMRTAKIFVSIMGDDTKQKLTLHGLESSAGFLQSRVAKRIDTRYTPRLSFVLDLGVKKSIEIAQILQQVVPKQPAEIAGHDADDHDADIDDPILDDSTADEADAADEADSDSGASPRSGRDGNDSAESS